MGGDSLIEVGGLITGLREGRGLSKSKLAKLIPADRAAIVRAEQGERISESLAARLDQVLETGGVISERRRRLVDPRTGRIAPGGVLKGGGEATDRRQFVGFGALSALVLVDERALGPDGVTLDDIEADVDEIAVAYGSAPNAELLPVAAARWQGLRDMFRGYLPPTVRNRAVLLYGQYSYYLGRMAFDANDARSARRFARQAGRCAGEAGEPVLIMSVAALRSTIDYWGYRYGHALDELRAVQHIRDPYMDARIAAFEARTLVHLGDHDAARAALDRMEAAACTMPPRPGEAPVGPAGVAMFRSCLGLSMGDAGMAAAWAPVAVDGYRRQGGDYNIDERQHAELNLALAHLLGSQRDPEEAARVATSAFALSPPTHMAMERFVFTARAFAPEHRGLPEVTAFTEAVKAGPDRPAPDNLSPA